VIPIKDEVSTYLKEIEDVGWVQETIMERFDNALELMSPNSIVYGGAVRDCLANKELLGDLDVAVSVEDVKKISESFQTNPKWVPMSKIRETIGEEGSSAGLANAFAPMSSMVVFNTLGNKQVQLITSKYRSKDSLQNSIYIARMVDIVCCGVIMLSDGRVFEAIPGAYQDCIDGVLRVNNGADTIFLDALEQRVDKLVKRGWKNLIDVPKTIKEIGIRREREKKKARRLMMVRRQSNPFDSKDLDIGTKEYYFTFDKVNPEITGGGYSSEISQRMIHLLFKGDPILCVNMLQEACVKVEENLKVKVCPNGSIYYTARNSYAANTIRDCFDSLNKKSLPTRKSKFSFAPKLKLPESWERVEPLIISEEAIEVAPQIGEIISNEEGITIQPTIQKGITKIKPSYSYTGSSFSGTGTISSGNALSSTYTWSNSYSAYN
jgi:hypothetical protein